MERTKKIPAELFCGVRVMPYLCFDLYAKYESLQSNNTGNNDPYGRDEKSSLRWFILGVHSGHRGLFVFSPEPDYIEAKTKKKLDRRLLEIAKSGNVRHLTTRLSPLTDSKVPAQIRDAKFQSLLKFKVKAFA